MPTSSAGLLSRSFAVFAKDLRLELRSRYAVSTILMFGVTTLTMVSFSLGQAGLGPRLLSALFWIILFFSAMAGLAQVFIREEEAGTALALRLSADPTAVYLGKLVFNLALLIALTVVVTPLFFIMTDASAGAWGAFTAVLVLGVLCLCAATTLVAAIIAKAAVKGTLFAVMCFPILVVPLFVLVNATAKALDGQPWVELSWELQGLFAYAVAMITASLMLFRFVWQE